MMFMNRRIPLLVLVFATMLLYGCIAPPPTPPVQPPVTEMPTMIPTPSSATPTPSSIPTITPVLNHTPRPIQTPSPSTSPVICPSYCLYGCEPGTDICKNPVCPETCPMGCEPGTTICKTVKQNFSMNNTDFEKGTYEGWTIFGTAYILFKGQEFTPGGPKDVILSNQERSYYEEPYSGYQGRYIASSFPDRRATGGIISQPFTINEDYVEFLIIGSEDRNLCVGLKIGDSAPDYTCERLQNNPATVRYLTPRYPIQPFARFTRVAWDVKDYKGQDGVVEVIDASPSWFLEVDDFQQTSTPTGILMEKVVPSYYNCNHNTICEHGLGEYELWCRDDCPPPTSCRNTAEESGLVDYTLSCYAFKLTKNGLNLTLKNTGIGRNHTILIYSIKCSEETHPDPATYIPVDAELVAGQAQQVADGTMPCFDKEGSVIKRKVGDRFIGRLFYVYLDESTNYTWYGRLNFDAVIQPE